VFGVLLIVEGVLVGLASLPLLILAGLGVIGLAIAASFCWSGAVLLGRAEGNMKIAAAVTVVSGGTLSFLTYGFLLAASCGVNCPPTLPPIVVWWPIALAVLNALCVIVMLTTRTHATRNQAGDRGQGS
jgi:hypothetical protein